MIFDASNIRQLFHGTCVDIEGGPRPGGYDGVFWTAETSTCAQNYIPAGSGSTVISIDGYSLDRRVAPHKGDSACAVALMIGPAARNVVHDGWGKAVSYGIPEGYPTYEGVAKHLESLGYKNEMEGGRGYRFSVKTGGWNSELDQSEIVPANYKQAGTLMVVDGFQEMKLYNMSVGDSDAMDLQYNKIDFFRKLEAEGYDGVVIDDFAQSKTWGNVVHRSIGFFASSCERLKIEAIPAVNFDWGPTSADLSIKETPEYATWSRAKAALATLPRSVPVNSARPG